MLFRPSVGRCAPKSASSSSTVGKDNWFSGGVMVRSRPRKSIVVMELLHHSFALTKTNVIIDIELLLSILFVLRHGSNELDSLNSPRNPRLILKPLSKPFQNY